MTHYHVATGLAGYGPDGADGYCTAENWRDAADMIRDELRDQIDVLTQDAETASERQDYEKYHDARELADSLAVLRENLDNKRAAAPLYAADPDAWERTIERTVTERFPLDVSTDGYQRIYVWKCEIADDKCEHNQVDD